ncbi:cupin domain-containing protein [Tunicatimonas pelagia]|uniref:cupin domain-containing protein n=1 Tax=Tunicatimonas pelagia TaxID=931531 RepID=UPI002665A77F|nr:cupin domain-containing protein [Tunicatimonas pelagia]WKN40558.1 cupin domain-containing protein [Tunicatimonas pelagia]
MKKALALWALCLSIANHTLAQLESPEERSIYKIPTKLLAGEGLKATKPADSSRVAHQKRVYDGKDIAIYMVAIGTGITNEFESFPMEEFIFWMNGKAVVEPANEASFEVHSGDFFVQAKGFRGKWNFVDNGGLHLELALIAKNRPDSTVKSPISKALVIDRDILSGVFRPTNGTIYQGAELTVNVLTELEQFEKVSQERMIHVLSGVLTVTTEDRSEYEFFPGDFFIVSENIEGSWGSSSLQDLRVLEVYKTKN